jgi:hypothetical protein
MATTPGTDILQRARRPPPEYRLAMHPLLASLP